MSKRGVALITGLEFEAHIARKLVKNTDNSCFVLTAGLGAPDAVRIVAEAKNSGALGIVSFGVCGGLDPALPPGSIVLPEIILAGGEIFVDLNWHKSIKKLLEHDFEIATGKILAVDKTVETVEEKAQLHRQSGACAIDMESGILAREAARKNLPFIAVRVIHDPATQAIPAAFADIMKPNGQIDPWKLVKGLMLNWPGFAELRKMSDNDAQARANLEGLTRLALPAFGRVDCHLNS